MSCSATSWRPASPVRVLALAALASLVVVPTNAAAARSGAVTAESTDDINVLRATDDELRDRIAEFDAQREATSSALAGAEAASTEARRQAASARTTEATARRAADAADDEVRQIAVSAYVGESDLNELAVFAAADPAEANRISVYLHHETQRRKDAFDAQRRAHSRLEVATVATDRAAVAFDTAVADRQTLLEELDTGRETQVLFAAAVEDRIEAKLAEVQALAEIDAAVAAEVAAQAVALQAANRGQPVARTPSPAVPVPGPVPPVPPAPPTTRAPAPPPTTRPSPTPTSPPPTTAPPALPTVTVTRVGPFVVATSIAANVRAMLDASAAAGFVLGGSGYRDSARQIELRIAHCGPTDYDIWEKPSSQCSPPTARPGRSMHERGLALDITCSGSLITSRSSPCFFWLAVYASGFGLYNLPSEPWHWSTTGT